MWTIINNTDFKADYQLGINTDPRTRHEYDLIWMVAIKATFCIKPGTRKLSISDEQVEINSTDQFRDDPSTSSLLVASDFAANKQAVDVLLNATAYSQGGKRAEDMLVSFRLGERRKVLKIIGDQFWESSMGMISKSYIIPFDKKEIIYEHAYGGWLEAKDKKLSLYDPSNPSGTGYFHKRSQAHRMKLPNIEYPDFPTKTSLKKNRVAGYGPIPPHWSPRQPHAGIYEPKNRADLNNPYAKNFDPLFYQAAPYDQQFSDINGNEPVGLLNMHPEFSVIEFLMPVIEIECETKMNNKEIRHTATIQTVIFQPDVPQMQMVWQTTLPCKQQGRTIEYTKIYSKIDPNTVN